MISYDENEQIQEMWEDILWLAVRRLKVPCTYNRKGEVGNVEATLSEIEGCNDFRINIIYGQSVHVQIISREELMDDDGDYNNLMVREISSIVTRLIMENQNEH